ncbi:nucleotide exchange factor GrpE [Silvibacterium dinghuense]|nr:nucleotide exchange factor GrpE [Silvibacterium dinghuense]
METVLDSNNNPLEERIRELEERVRQEHDLYLRALADFDNYRRRIDRERTNTVSTAKREILLPLLEVLDGLELALHHAEDAASPLTQGVRAIQRRFLSLLEHHKVETIQSVGEPFDPRVHEAIDSVPSEEHPSGTIVEEVQRGYRLGDDLLRPARVRVAA